MGKRKQQAQRRTNRHEWTTEEGLLKIEGWAKTGLSNRQIAENIGINEATLYKWKNEESEIDKALKKGKAVIDFQVENALLKRALGYDYIESVKVPERMTGEEFHAYKQFERMKYKDANPSASLEEIELYVSQLKPVKMVTERETHKQVAGDVTAMIFWLKNRKPEVWRDTQLTEQQVRKVKTEADILEAKLNMLKGVGKDTTLLEALGKLFED